MTKPTYEELEAEVAYLRRELGMVDDHQAVARISQVYKLQRGCARILWSLYQAKGRYLTAPWLADRIESSDACGRTIDVLVYRIRDRLGADVIESARHQGYRIAAAGVQVVERAMA